MPETSAAPPATANGSSVTITQTDWKAELIRPAGAWFTSLGKVEGICLLLLSACLMGLAYIAVDVLPNERRLLSESYEKIDQRHAEDMLRMQAQHQVEIRMMFGKIEEISLRFEAIAHDNKQLVSSLVDRVIDGAVKK